MFHVDTPRFYFLSFSDEILMVVNSPCIMMLPLNSLVFLHPLPFLTRESSQQKINRSFISSLVCVSTAFTCEGDITN